MGKPRVLDPNDGVERGPPGTGYRVSEEPARYVERRGRDGALMQMPVYHEVRYCAAVDCGRRIGDVVEVGFGVRSTKYCCVSCMERAKRFKVRARKRVAERAGMTPSVAPERVERLPLASLRAAEHMAEERFEEIRLEAAARSEAAYAKLAGLAQIPLNRADIRAAISVIVVEELDRAQRVLSGDEKWDRSQVKVWEALMDRALPAAAPERNAEQLGPAARKKLEEMSVAELSELLAESTDGEVLDG